MAHPGSTAPQLVVHEGEPPLGWRAAIEAEGGFFHTEAWSRHRCHAGEGEPLFCEWRGDGEVVARALALRRPARSSLAGRLVGRVLLDSTPATTREGLDFVHGLSGWARRRRSVFEVVLGSFDAQVPWRPGPPPGAVRRVEFLVEQDDPDALLDAVGGSVRRNVRKAEKAGVTVRRAGVDELSAFAGLYMETLRSLEERKGVDAVSLAAERFAASLTPIVEGEHGRLYVACREDGSAEAGWVFGVAAGRACGLYSGAAASARQTGSTSLALTETMRGLVSEGISHINLGGTPAEASDPESPDHGLYNFKLRFGARVVERNSGSLMMRPRRATAIGLARRVLRR